MKIYKIIKVDKKNEKEPSSDLFPYIFVFPYLTPINAATESEILITRRDAIIRFISSKNKRQLNTQANNN